MKSKVAVIGLGYVGLPLAVSAAKNGYEVLGIDTNLALIEQLENGTSPVEDISSQEILSAIQSDKFQVSAVFSEVSKADIVVICLPTPLDKNRKPDLSFIESGVQSFSKHLRKEALIILESTVQPGTTRNYLPDLIMQYSNIDRKSFEIAYSPERIDPLNKIWNLNNTPKIVSGLTENATKRAVEFYSRFVKSLVVCDSVEVAELAKLLENTFRYVNISFINELSIFCHKLGVDVNKVIDAAASKPYGFMPFYPSIGVGGHCIPVDPLYLAEKAQQVGASSRFIDLADEINLKMPEFFVGRAEEKLGGLDRKRIIVVGVSYKPNVADTRETPALALINGLKQKGALVFWHDDLVKEWNGEKSTPLSDEYDLAILAVAHDYLDLTKLGSIELIATRNLV